MANDKIKVGLAKGEGYTSKTTARSGPKLAHLVGKKNTLPNIRTNQLRAVTAYRRLRLLGDKSAEKMAELEQMIRTSWDERAWVHDELNGVPIRRPIMSSEELKRNIDRDLDRAQKAVNQEQAEELAKLMKEIGEAGAANALYRKGMKTPHVKLLSDTIGERRAVLLSDMRHQGVLGIERAMAKALADNDAEMAAAACIAYDTLNEEQKSLVEYSRDDVAEALVWDEWRDLNAACEKTLYAVDMAHVVADQMQGRKVAAGKKTTIALRFHEAGLKLGLEFKEDELAPPTAPAPTVNLNSQQAEKPPTTVEQDKEAEDLKEFTELVGKGNFTAAHAIGGKYGWSEVANKGENTNE